MTITYDVPFIDTYHILQMHVNGWNWFMQITLAGNVDQDAFPVAIYSRQYRFALQAINHLFAIYL